jgi:hypothetical protein
MCRALYIASDRHLPLIPWNESNPGFCVVELQEFEETVRKHFTLPFIVYAGSFEGCSCGFAYGDEPIEDDEYEQKRDKQARESVNLLREYIMNILENGSIELFTCYEGEQGFEPEERLVVDLEFFNTKEFGFKGINHFKVIE